jgi:hypothetical protein
VWRSYSDFSTSLKYYLIIIIIIIIIIIKGQEGKINTNWRILFNFIDFFWLEKGEVAV